MNISGFIKQSLIDYPGQIASVVFTQGCNFRCPYCHNHQLIPLNEGSIPTAELLAYFQKNRLLLDAVVITGGEPTLQKDLRVFIFKIKYWGLKVKLDTNGSNPEILSELLRLKLIDYVAMDIKSELTDEAYTKTGGIHFSSERLNKVRQSIHLLIHSGIEHEFRTTICRELISLENIRSIINALEGAQRYFIQQYCPYPQQSFNEHSFSVYNGEELYDMIKRTPATFPVFLRE